MCIPKPYIIRYQKYNNNECYSRKNKKQDKKNHSLSLNAYKTNPTKTCFFLSTRIFTNNLKARFFQCVYRGITQRILHVFFVNKWCSPATHPRNYTHILLHNHQNNFQNNNKKKNKKFTLSFTKANIPKVRKIYIKQEKRRETYKKKGN